MKKLLFVLAIMMSLSGATFATEYYVNFGCGSDSNDGTSETTPFKTFDKVDSLNLQGGDIVSVCGYGKVYLTGKSGSAGNPITIRPYESTYGGSTYRGCTLNATEDYGVALLNCSYIVVDGARKSDGAVGYIEFRQPAWMGAFTDNSNHCVFKNLYIHDIGSADQNNCAAFFETGGSHHNTFIRNFIKHITAGQYSTAFISLFNTEAQSSVFAYNTVADVGNVTRAEYGTVAASNNICYNIRGNTGSTAVFVGGTHTDNNLCYGYQSKYDGSVTGRGPLPPSTRATIRRFSQRTVLRGNITARIWAATKANIPPTAT